MRLLQGQTGIPATHPGSRAPAECRPRLPSLQGTAGRRTRGHTVRSPGLEPGQPSRTTSTSDWRVYLNSATSAWSRYPVSSRAVRRTKAESQAVRIGMASGAGVEPARADFRGLLGAPTSHPESSTRSGTRTRRRQGLGLPAFPISVIRAYAARDSNSVLRSKSPVHHLSCLRRSRAVPGNRTPIIRLEAWCLSR